MWASQLLQTPGLLRFGVRQCGAWGWAQSGVTGGSDRSRLSGAHSALPLSLRKASALWRTCMPVRLASTPAVERLGDSAPHHKASVKD